MEPQEVFLLIFSILGGLALFLYGMGIMTRGLRVLAGDRLRGIVHRGTRNRFVAMGMGTGLGFLIHSTATTVMTVGFLNAGLLSLAQAIPVFFGANIGTTLSMQLVSFRLTDYAYVAVSLGFLLMMVAPGDKLREAGRAFFGFGLLFVGMALMSGSIEPHRDALLPLLSIINGETWGGLLTGTLAAALFTIVVQSSGATIGMAFVLTSIGAFSSLEQVYPIVLGAQLGTTGTALIASLGGGMEARRGALANLAFILFSVTLAIVASPIFVAVISQTSDDVVRQTANLHTAIMVVGAVILIPFTALFATVLQRLTPSRQPATPTSFLDPELVDRPESALTAVVLELQRSLEILRTSLAVTRSLFKNPNQKRASRKIDANEAAIDEIREAIRSYISRITHHYLSRRQRLLSQYLTHIAIDIERIGDHIENLARSAQRNRNATKSFYDASMREALLDLFDETDRILKVCIKALDPDQKSFPKAAEAIEEACTNFSSKSEHIQRSVNTRVANHEVSALAGIYFSGDTLLLDRLVRHCKMIGREKQQPHFALNPKKLERIEPSAKAKSRPPRKAKADS